MEKLIKFRDTNYYVSPTGKVYSLRKNKKSYNLYRLKNNLLLSGYHQVSFYINKRRKNYLVHRLVAECYLNTWDNNLEVNHIDKNKTNNNILNLEMVTSKENYDHKINEKSYYILVNKITKEEIKFKTLSEITRHFNKKRTYASDLLRKETKKFKIIKVIY